MAQQITTIRLPEEVRERVDNLAAATGRSMNYHIQRAVEEYLERQSWQVPQILSAREQARAGQGISLDEYLERSIANGTATHEGYEQALAEEMADVTAQQE